MLLNDDYEIKFPHGFDDLEREAEAKGWLQGVVIVIGEARFVVTIYEPTRLMQDIEGELQGRTFFLERNTIVVPSVTRAHISAAIGDIVRTGAFADLIPEKSATERT